MFQACVSISMFLWIYTGYVCINGHILLGKKNKKLPTYPPYFSVAHYANTTINFFWPKAKAKEILRAFMKA